jgi:predicted transcriptional regulator
MVRIYTVVSESHIYGFKVYSTKYLIVDLIKEDLMKKISLIIGIAAHNEEANIGKLLQNLLTQRNNRCYEWLHG